MVPWCAEIRKPAQASGPLLRCSGNQYMSKSHFTQANHHGHNHRMCQPPAATGLLLCSHVARVWRSLRASLGGSTSYQWNASSWTPNKGRCLITMLRRLPTFRYVSHLPRSAFQSSSRFPMLYASTESLLLSSVLQKHVKACITQEHKLPCHAQQWGVMLALLAQAC